MPSYVRQCPRGHQFDHFAPMAEASAPVRCEKHGEWTTYVWSVPHVGGDVQLTAGTLKTLVGPFKQSTVNRMRTRKDVDRKLAEFNQKYGHFGTAHRMGNDEASL